MSRAIAIFHGRFGRAALYDLNRPFNLHAHREGHLIFCIGGSDGHLEVSGRTCTLTRDTAVAVSPWEPHNFTPRNRAAGALFLVLYVNPEWFGADAGRLRFGRPLIRRTAALDLLVRRTAARVYAAHRLDDLDGDIRCLIEACHDETWRQGGEAARAPDGVSDFRVRKSIRLMRETLGADIELDGIARESGLSRPHFYKLFRIQTGVTPHLYLNTLLMERAIERLVQTPSPVADIGFDLGFSSQSGFARFFASNVGMAPSDYRRAAQLI